MQEAIIITSVREYKMEEVFVYIYLFYYFIPILLKREHNEQEQ